MWRYWRAREAALQKLSPPCLFGARERNSALNVLESNAYLSNVWIFALFLIALLISR